MPPKFVSAPQVPNQESIEKVKEVIPENGGWCTASTLRFELGGENESIQKRLDEIAEEKAKQNNVPITEYRKFGKPKGMGGRDTFYFSLEILDIYRNEIADYNKKNNVEDIPENGGWMTSSTLMADLGGSQGVMQKRLDEIAEEKAKQNNVSITEYRKFGKTKVSKGVNALHFSQEILDIYRNEIIEYNKKHNVEVVPEIGGWGTASALMAELGGSSKILQKRLDEIAEEKAKQNNVSITEYRKFGKTKVSKGVNVLHFSQEILDIYRNEIIKYNKKNNVEVIPEMGGWKTLSALMAELGGSSKILQKRLDEIAEEKAKQNNVSITEYRKFGKLIGMGGGDTFYFSQEVCDMYRVEITEFNNANTIEVIPETGGWNDASSLKVELGGNLGTIQKRLDEIAEEKAKENFVPITEYRKFGKFKGLFIKCSLHFSQEICDMYRAEIAEYNKKNIVEDIPENGEWSTSGTLSRVLGINREILQKRLNEIAEEKAKQNDVSITEYRKFGKPKWSKGFNVFHFSQEICDMYRAEISEYNKKNIVEDIPENGEWNTVNIIRNELGGGIHVIQKRLDEIAVEKAKHNDVPISEYRKFGKSKESGGYNTTHFSQEICDVYRHEIAKYNKENKVEDIPETGGWGTANALITELGGNLGTIQKRLDEIAEEKAKENFVPITEYRKFGKFKGSKVINTLHFSQEILDIYRNEIIEYNKKNKVEVIPETGGWNTANVLRNELGGGIYVIQKRLEEIAEEKAKKDNVDIIEYRKFGKPNGSNGHNAVHFSQEILDIYRHEITQYNKENNLEVIPETGGWNTASGLKVELGGNSGTIQKRLDEIAEEKARQNDAPITEYRKFGKPNGSHGKSASHFSQEICDVYRSEREVKKEKKEQSIQELQEVNRIKDSCDEFLENIIEGKSIELEDFKKLMSLFGSARVVDLLYAFHPEFKKLPVEYLKSELAKYLGDYMVVRSGNVLGDVELALPYLGEKSFQESLFTVIKEDAIHYYQVNKKKHKEKEDNRILDEYITLLKDKAILFHNDDFDDVVSQVESYIFSILNDFDKPKNIIDELNQGRTFPDLNQTINIKEVRDGRRVLIGDEMGMGKSASAILSKEYLGVGMALVVVPSNVISTWRRYVSDDVGPDGKQLGYFKKGSAPRVLEIGSIEDITKIQSGEFDYVIISHEKFNSEYAEKLKDSPIEMVIIDEVHKFKNVNDGVRSQALLGLMQKFKEREAYTILLSSTPVPNKIQDLAVTLKLLYPEEFGLMDNAVLVSSIIKGDNINLRDLLFKKTQMKKLAESVDMPEKVERDSFVEMSAQERELYELLLDDDELTATEKLMTLRQFCLNPRKVFPDIEIQSSKVREAKHAIESHFETNNKLVFFVNGYIDGIIRGDNSILEQMQLPSDITIKIIDGAVSKEERAEIERDLKYMTHGKVLLVLSGQAADVGVDFSSAESVYFYNEPWTKFDKMQQQARVYRPGLTHDITVDTSLVEGSVEEGIHYYLEMKYKAVMKLLEGVPLSEIEQKMLLLNEKISDNKTIEGDQGLAEEWLQSPVNRLNRFFGATKEIGEEKMKGFLEKYGEEYAEYYAEMGSRGFQANTSRLVTALIKKYQEEKGVESPMIILDVASGPEMLRKRMNKDDAENLYSLDINKNHFTEQNWRQVVAGFTDTQFADNSVDYLNMSLAVHYSAFRPSRDEFERLEVFGEIARVLKVGGRSTINLVHSLEWKNRDELGQLLKELGMSVVDGDTGLATSGNRFMSECLTFEKVQEINSKEKIEVLKNEGSDLLEGLKLTTKGKTKLRKSQEIIKDFSLNGADIEVVLNEEDTHLLHEQESAHDEWKVLFEEYDKNVEKIPRETLLKKSILRYVSGRKYKFVKKGAYSGSFIRLN